MFVTPVNLLIFCSVPCSRSHYCLVSPIDTPNVIHTFLSGYSKQNSNPWHQFLPFYLFFLLWWLSHLGLIIIIYNMQVMSSLFALYINIKVLRIKDSLYRIDQELLQSISKEHAAAFWKSKNKLNFTVWQV